MKRIISLFLSVLLIVSAIPQIFAADSTVRTLTVEAPTQYASVGVGSDQLGKVTADIESLKAYLFEELYKCSPQIDLTSFEIPVTQDNMNAISSMIHYEIVEAFHVSQISFSFAQTILSISPVYTYTADEYQSMYSECVEKADKLLAGIRDNASLTDVEKALLLHDRIALECEYDIENYYNGTIPPESYTIYGVLAKGYAVCQGYSETYAYLLDQVGITSRLCESESLDHTWNIVEIDGKSYHVDITWDDAIWHDSAWDVKGGVTHENFLLSSDALYNGVNGSEGHVATDYDTTPSDTTYDSYFWQNSDTAFQLIDGEVYYIDNVNATLNRFSDGEVLHDLNDTWEANEFGSYWPGNYSKLASDGENLLFSMSDSIYSYNPKLSETTKLHTPELTGVNAIYGLAYENGSLVYDIHNSPNFRGENMIRETFRIRDDAPNLLNVTTTNDVEAFQTFYAEFTDDFGIAGYYWSADGNLETPSFQFISGPTLTKTITEPGSYLFYAEDTSGNVSAVFEVNYYKTILNPNGGTVSLDYIISPEGILTEYASVILPTPEREGYIFKGWATSPDATEGEFAIVPESNKTYYAIWEIEAQCTHFLTVTEEAVSATCINDGYTGDTICMDCGTVVTEGTVIPATGEHTGGTASCVDKAICTVCGTSYGEVDPAAHGETEIRDAVAETCGKAGYTGDTYCKDCDVKIATGTVIPATGNHTGGTASCVDKAICTVCGTSYGEVDATAHGETEIRDAVAETCGKAGYTGDTYCKDCDVKIDTGTAIPAIGKHTGGTASCVNKAVCTVCGIAYGEVDTTAHGETEIRDAVTETCSKSGYTGDTYCKDCGTKIATGTAIPATGKHTGGTATCVDKAICEVCGIAYGELNPTAHGETEIRDTVTETCGKAGYTGDTYCKDCGAKISTGTAISATGKHTGGTASCVEKAICTVCETAYGEVDSTAHGETELRNAADPTATTDGYTGDTCCIDCGTVLTPGETIPALGIDIDLDELANDETVSLKLYKDAAHTQQITDPADIPLGEKIYYTLDAAEGYNVAQIKSTASYMDSECMILDDYDLTFEITSVLAGNFDGNDALNVLDAIWIVRYISGWKDNPDEWIITEDTLAGDYDGNGIVNVLDAISIVKLQSGLEEPHGGIQTTHSAIVDVDYEKAETITITNAEEGTTTILITTADELKTYSEDLSAKYDTVFFETKDLVIITTSVSTEFVSFKQINGIFTVDLTESNPSESGAAHILIIPKGVISNADQFVVDGN